MMKLVGGIVIFLLGLSAIIFGARWYTSFGSPNGFLEAMLKVVIGIGAFIFGLYLWSLAEKLFSSHIFDYKVTKIRNQVKAGIISSESVEVDCYTEEQAREFWRISRDQYQSRKWDSDTKKLTVFRKK